MKYEVGSYCDIESKCEIIVFPQAEDQLLERFKILIEELDLLLEEYDSEHLIHSYMELKKSMALYIFFSGEYDFE